MTRRGWNIYRDYQAWSDSERLFIVHRDRDDVRSLVQPLALEAVALGVAHEAPTLASPEHDTRGFLQAALDCAWDAGLRPTGFADHTKELTAVRFHLADMRSLAFKGKALDHK